MIFQQWSKSSSSRSCSYAKEVKCKTIGVSSLDYAKLAPKSKFNKRLDEVVNIYINNHGPPGDTLLSISDTQKVSPFSTISGAYIKPIIAHVAELCKEEELFPFFISANMPNAVTIMKNYWKNIKQETLISK